MTEPPVWIIMPIAGAEGLTDAAISDCLSQSVPIRLLLINQGISTDFRTHLERVVEEEPEKIFLWSHQPPLPSLSATWNRALNFVWEVGGTEALVVNNDVRLDPRTVSILHAVRTWPKAGNLFVSAVGVTAEQFDSRTDPLFDGPDDPQAAYDALSKGGPDFSCFMLSQQAHTAYPFDESFIPAYCEDLDSHRRYMLGGDGTKIFSINLPYLHYGSGTLKGKSPEEQAALSRKINGSRAYYAKKWGGPVNHERYTIPFDPDSAQDGVTTPELQRSLLWPVNLPTTSSSSPIPPPPTSETPPGTSSLRRSKTSSRPAGTPGRKTPSPTSRKPSRRPSASPRGSAGR
jgi:hypothetical protein